MRIRIETVYDTAYEYKEILKKYNYEHILNDNIDSNRDYFDNYSKYEYTDYITIKNLEVFFELVKTLNVEVIVKFDNLYNFANGEPVLEIYDNYRK